MTTSHSLNRRTLLQMAAALSLASTALYGGGVIGAGEAMASTKQIAGIGIRVRKNPGGPTSRVRAVASDGAGRFSVTVADTGNQSVDIDKAALQMAVNGQAATSPAGAAERMVVVRFAPGLRVSGPNGQSAVQGKPGVFILSSGTQTFVVAGMAAGSVISGVIETADAGDLFPGAAQGGVASTNRNGDTPPRFELPRGSFGGSDRMIPRNDINPLPRPRPKS
ncbi:hypothetical protein [Novosphingobium sp.]|uniref:hypothetical protein n=1 Tax=Novosphingobium sp. TaxID=1874826 RepID=UPI00286DC4A4|nr:hypothetical protein [Novosphingobium sp.]